MKEYTVTIELTNGIKFDTVLFAKDRKDAIAFVKRNNQMRFFRKEYKRITGAKLLKPKKEQEAA